MIKLHPAIVHFPIALLSVAALFAVLSLFSKRDFFKEVAFWNLLLGVVGAVVAVLTGLIEEQHLIHNEAIHQILEKHKFIGFAILIFSQILLMWYWIRKNKVWKGEYIIWVILLVLGTIVLSYQAFLGGRMVFEQGAGVKPMEPLLKKESHNHAHSEEEDHTNEHKLTNDHDTTASKRNMPEMIHEHKLTNDHDTTASKMNMPEMKHDAHSNSEHGHMKGTDTAASKKPIPKKKKQLKDMKY